MMPITPQPQQQGQQQQQDQQQQRQQHPRRATLKCCGFCAKSGNRCDGLRPRCSICIEENHLECHYRQKQATRARSKAAAAPHPRVSNDAARPVGEAKLTSSAEMVAMSRGQSTSNVSVFIPLKRCGLKPSPATGLVGMQESTFLNDYFECLGFLPLASASVVRQAIVELMLGAMPPQGEGRHRGQGNSLTDGKQGEHHKAGEEGKCSQGGVYGDRGGDSSRCIMWCAIALGALVQGCSFKFVAGYLQLARNSLAECFDSTTLETARAFQVMAVLQTFLGDQETSQRYIAFAKRIVGQLPPGVVPSDMQSMLLADGDDSRLFHYGHSDSGVGTNAEDASEESIQIPSVNSFVNESDVCHFYFIAETCMHKAFFQDLRGKGDSTNVNGEGGRKRRRYIEGQPGQFQRQGELGRDGEMVPGEGCVLGVPPRSGDYCIEGVTCRGPQNRPPIGAALKACLEDVSPDFTRLLAGIERSGEASGVVALLFHGPMGYMRMVQGDMRSAFRSTEVCARVLMRFPGLCRYRPHVIHCVLCAAASRRCRRVYDPVRDVYNAVLPLGGTPAPPLEEWRGMNCICNHVFCRSLHVEPNDVDTASSTSSSGCARTSAAPAPPAPPSRLHTSPIAERPRGLHGDPACDVKYVVTSAAEALPVAGPTQTANGVLLSPSSFGETPSQGKVDNTADR